MNQLTFDKQGSLLQIADADEILARLKQFLPEELHDLFDAAVANDSLDSFLKTQKQKIVEHVPEPYRFLLDRAHRFEQADVDLLDWTHELGEEGGSHRFSIGVGANLSLSAVPAADGMPAVQADEKLLSLKLMGNYNLGANFTTQSSPLTVGANFTRKGDQQLSYYVAADSDDYMLQVVTGLRHVVVSPADLEATIEHFDNSDLRKVQRSGSSTTTIGVKVGISKEISTLIDNQPLDASLGFDLALDFSDHADFSISVEKTANGNFVVEQKKARKRKRSSVLKLGVDVKLSGFRNRLLEKITQVLPEETGIDKALQDIDKISEQITVEALREKLKEELVDKWKDGKPAIAFLIGETSASEFAETIQGELQDKIEELINTQVDVWNDDASAAGEKVATKLAAELALSDQEKAQFEGYIAIAVEKGLSSAQGKLEEKISELIESVDLDQHLQSWDFVGEEVTDAIDAISNRATNAVDKAKTALQRINQRYTRFRQRVLTLVKEDLEEELSIAIVSEKERTTTVTRTVRLEASQVTPAVTALYEALWTGDLRKLPQLASELEGAPETISLTGEYVRIAERMRKTTLSINFFGVKLSSVSMFSDRVEVGIDNNGRLITANSKAELVDERQRRGEKQSLIATWKADFLSQAQLTSPLTIKVRLVDNKFTANAEVEDFFSPLEEAGVMRDGVGDDVESELFGHDNQPIAAATLTINVPFRWSDWLRIVGSNLDGTDVAHKWEPNAVCDEYLHFARMLAPEIIERATKYMERNNSQNLRPFLYALGSISTLRKAYEKMEGTSRRRNISPKFQTTYNLGRAIFSLANGISTLQTEWRTLLSQLPDEDESLSERDTQKLQETIEKVNHAFGQAFAGIFSTGYLLDDAGEINWMTASALKVFQQNTDLPNPFLSCTVESQAGKSIFS